MKKNNYFMSGIGFIDEKENITIINSAHDTTVHKHDFIEIVYFYSSQGNHVVNNENYYIYNGHLCILNSGIEHHYSITPTQDEEISVRNIIFYPTLFGEEFTAENFIDEMYEKLMGCPPKRHYDFIQISKDYNKDFFKLISMMQNELMKKESNYLDVIKNCLMTVFIKIFRETATDKKPTMIMLNNIKIIESSLHYIEERYAENLSLLDISMHYNLSNIYFNQLFKAYTGQSFKKYLQKFRMEKAKELLQQSDDTLDVICQKVGYTDLKQFHLLFKRIVGLTPFQYKKSIRSLSKQ